MGGWWPKLLAAMRIRPGQMDWRRLGMRLQSRDDQRRVESICEAVAGGFNTMICAAGSEEWVVYCESVEAHYRPFAREGAALGYLLRHPWRSGRRSFEPAMVRAHPEGTYMYYVGAGFWQGMRRGSRRGLERLVKDWDPMYRLLCYDGFGFKHGFFNYGRIERLARRLSRPAGYGGQAAMQGVGRSLWFRFMNDADRLLEEIGRFEEEVRGDLAAGLGLASVFVHLDCLEPVWELALRMPESWRGDFQLGMSFGFRARQMNDGAYFEECMSTLPAARRAGVREALVECGRIEREIREDGEADGYRRWREGLTEWMERNLRYPLEATTVESTEAA